MTLFRRQLIRRRGEGAGPRREIGRHERIMLQFFPIILLRIAQKCSRLFSILFSTFFDIFTDPLMFTTYSLIMAQVEFSIVGKNVVESELK